MSRTLIADEGFREPSSYRDAFVILMEQGIIPKEEIVTYEKIAMFRNLLVHYYEKINDEIVFSIFKERLGDFENYIKNIVNYIGR